MVCFTGNSCILFSNNKPGLQVRFDWYNEVNNMLDVILSRYRLGQYDFVPVNIPSYSMAH
jgi:hypothetical protein